MKAVIYEKYGSYEELKISEIERPEPLADEVLVKIHAVSLNRADEYMLKGSPFLIRFMNGFFKPKLKILGFDISGTVEAIGKDIKNFKLGEEVFGNTYSAKLGGLAEYACVKDECLVKKPGNISHEEAAASPQAAVTALQAINKANINEGQRVLINGASGGVGLYALQIAKAYGAEVTAVCSERSAEVAKSKGADQIIDYTKEDFTKNGIKYDVILGVNGYHALKDYKSSLTDKGTYVMIGGTGAQLFEGMLLTPLYSEKNGRKLVGLGEANSNQKDLQEIKRLLESSAISAFIDSSYPLEETSEAFRYLIEEHAKGKVVIRTDV